MHAAHQPIPRRQFAKRTLQGASAVAIGTATPKGWIQSLAASLTDQDRDRERVLVVIQLSGGNDGLNTIIPIANDDYYKARPKLAIPKNESLNVAPECGLHPSLRGIASLMDERKFTVLHGVGYPGPNRSHFESMDIWHSCSRKESRTSDGWLGRYFAQTKPSTEVTDSCGLHLGNEQLPMALVARGVQTPSLASIDQLRWKGRTADAMPTLPSLSMRSSEAVPADSENHLLDFVSASTASAMRASERLDKALASPDDSGDFPNSQLGEKLKVISRLLLAGLRTRVYYVTLDGFDTHANQLAAHAGLMRQWSDALSAFHKRLDRAGLGERVLAFTFSEFGRRVAENASLGTDHGAASPAFLSGPSLKHPIFGSQPSLNALDDGDLKFHTDFRSVYATLIEDWLGTPSKNILAGEYSKLQDLGLASVTRD